MLLKYGSVGSIICEMTGALVTPYTSKEIVRSVSSTRYAGGGPVIGISTSIQSRLGRTRTPPICLTGARESPANPVGAVVEMCCACSSLRSTHAT